MKYCLAIVMLFPFLSWSQNCNLKTTRDPYTKEIKVSTGFFSLNNARGSIEATKSEIDFMFQLEGKCFDGASNAAVYFEGSRLKTNFKNTGTMNCDGLLHFTFRNTDPSPTALQNLGTKKISAIRFKDNSGKETGVSFTSPQQQQFMDLVNCVISESKKLVQ